MSRGEARQAGRQGQRLRKRYNVLVSQGQTLDTADRQRHRQGELGAREKGKREWRVIRTQ